MESASATVPGGSDQRVCSQTGRSVPGLSSPDTSLLLVCPELRWLVSRRCGSMDAYGMARLALRLLHALASRQSAVEVTGDVLQPLPKVHRYITSSQCLPHVCQVR